MELGKLRYHTTNKQWVWEWGVGAIHAVPSLTKLSLREILSNLWNLRVVFFVALGICSWWNLKSAFSKRGLVVKFASLMSIRIRAIAVIVNSSLHTVLSSHIILPTYITLTIVPHKLREKALRFTHLRDNWTWSQDLQFVSQHSWSAL